MFPYNKELDILLYEGGHTAEEIVIYSMEHYADYQEPPTIKEVGRDGHMPVIQSHDGHVMRAVQVM